MNLTLANRSILKRLLSGRRNRPLKAILGRIAAADLATLFGELTNRDIRLLIDALMSIDKATDVLIELPTPQIQEIFELLETNKIYSLLNYCPEDHAAYILSGYDEEKQESLLEKLDKPRQRRLRQLLSYPEDSAGRIMDTQVFTVSVEKTAQETIDLLRSKSGEQLFYYIYCVDDEGHLIGVLSLRALAMAKANTKLKEIAKRDLVTVSPETPSEEVARLVSHFDIIAIPVVDSSQKLLGIITVDDVVDIIQEQATAEAYASAGLQEGDKIYSTTRESVKFRLPWMILNLFTAIMASLVVSVFEKTLSELIVLATLNNIVAGMGGNTGIQTLTVVTRGLATGDFNFISYGRAVLKECSVGLVVGSIVGVLCGFIVYLWKDNILVASVIVLAMIINSFVATFTGALVPLILKKLKWDPAVGSGVVVTTCTDIAGFFSFLGIATLALKIFGVEL